MSKQDTHTDATDDKSIQKSVTQFVTGIFRRVFEQIPATIIAIIVGTFGGGFIGLAFGPLVPLFALGGAVLLGFPVAIWEYKIKERGGSAWDIQ